MVRDGGDRCGLLEIELAELGVGGLELVEVVEDAADELVDVVLGAGIGGDDDSADGKRGDVLVDARVGAGGKSGVRKRKAHAAQHEAQAQEQAQYVQ